jgi:hypothetical protein
MNNIDPSHLQIENPVTNSLYNYKSVALHLKSEFNSDDPLYKFNPIFTLSYNGIDKPDFSTIAICIDTSGSVWDKKYEFKFNLYNTQTIKNEHALDSADIQTKMVIIAELEGLAHYFCALMNRYNLTGIRIKIVSFGKTVLQCYDNIVSSNEHFMNDVRKLDEYVLNDGGSTNLGCALQNIFSTTDQNTLLELVVLTDGQANNGMSKNEIHEYMRDICKTRKVNIVAIGAGNTQKSHMGSNTVTYCGCNKLCTMSGLMSYNVNGQIKNENVMQREYTTDDITRSATCVDSQCDMEFLIRFVTASKHRGQYIPAYGNYSNLINAIRDYVNDTFVKKNLRYGTLMDNGSIFLLPYHINNQLIKSEEYFIAYVNPIVEWYLFTREWQCKVQFEINDLPFAVTDIIFVDVPLSLKKSHLNIISNTKVLSFPDFKTKSGITFCFMANKLGLPRIRIVTVKNE